MSAPTPEDVALAIIARVTVGGFPLSDLDGAGVLTKQIAAALRAARAAAIEEAARVCEDRMPATQDMTSTFVCGALEDAAAAIRALGEESAAPREEATEPRP